MSFTFIFRSLAPCNAWLDKSQDIAEHLALSLLLAHESEHNSISLEREKTHGNISSLSETLLKVGVVNGPMVNKNKLHKDTTLPEASCTLRKGSWMDSSNPMPRKC